MTLRTTAILCAFGGLAASAAAQPTFIAFGNETMYRFTLNGAIETFQLSDKMMSLAVAPSGRIFGHSAERNSGQLWESYELVDFLGNNPSLSLLSDQVPGPRPALSFADGTAYGTREDANDTTELITFDTDTLIDDALIGNTGLGRGTNGSGYDPVSDTLYLINRERDGLFSVDRSDGSVTFIGSLGIDYFNGGAEFFDGTLYAWLQDATTNELILGTVDTGTGAFTALRSVAMGDPNDTTFMSLAVVPAPGALALLGLGGMAAARRRR
jgi:Ca2+-binding RTX toxin-like protein